MARVFGPRISRGAKYMTIHPFPADVRIVRLVEIDTLNEADDPNDTFKVRISAAICRKIRSRFAYRKEKLNATIARVLASFKEEDAFALFSENTTTLTTRRPIGGIASIKGLHVNPDTVFKAVELQGRGLFRLDAVGEIPQGANCQTYQIKIPADLAKSIREQFQAKEEALSQTIEKVLSSILCDGK